MFKNIWQRNWIWITALTIGLLGAFAAAGLERVNAEQIQQGIAGEIIRFHVLANSDSEADQTLKMQVKETVVGQMKEMLAESDSVEESRVVIEENLEEIESIAKAEIERRGYNYGVTASLAAAYFPQKTYGDCTFPEGWYEALQIKIGEAKGRNWWCVVYPSLCFTDSVQGIVSEEDKEELKKILTNEEYDNILHGAEMKVSFRWLKW